MKKYTGLLLVLVVCVSARAQNYNWGIGLRGGGIASGVDFKYNFDPANSTEVLVSFAEGVAVYGLYERNVPVIGRGFNFYYGAGLHIGTWEWNDDKGATFGLDVVAGLEYKIPQAPIAFSVDWKPCLNLTGHTGLKGYDFGLAMRYTF